MIQNFVKKVVSYRSAGFLSRRLNFQKMAWASGFLGSLRTSFSFSESPPCSSETSIRYSRDSMNHWVILTGYSVKSSAWQVWNSVGQRLKVNKVNMNSLRASFFSVSLPCSSETSIRYSRDSMNHWVILTGYSVKSSAWQVWNYVGQRLIKVNLGSMRAFFFWVSPPCSSEMSIRYSRDSMIMNHWVTLTGYSVRSSAWQVWNSIGQRLNVNEGQLGVIDSRLPFPSGRVRYCYIEMSIRYSRDSMNHWVILTGYSVRSSAWQVWNSVGQRLKTTVNHGKFEVVRDFLLQSSWLVRYAP